MGRSARFCRRAVPVLTVVILALTTFGAQAAEQWTFGSLAMPRAGSSILAGLDSDKQRLFSLSLPGLAVNATVRSWFSRPSNGAFSGPASGFLIDVPLGAFQLTPSVGAGMTARSFASGPSIEIRSGVELGYEFGDHSRFSVGISRASGDRTRSGGDPDDIFAFYYRLPLGW